MEAMNQAEAVEKLLGRDLGPLFWLGVRYGLEQALIYAEAHGDPAEPDVANFIVEALRNAEDRFRAKA